MTAHPLVSVIIPTFNRAKMVCDCVRSVLASNYPEFEVIVIDDCSTENVGATLRATTGEGSGDRFFAKTDFNN